jgi:hypothetical protein
MGGSVETGKIRKMIWETSLHRHYWGKRCGECSNFSWEHLDGKRLRRNYCHKWIDEVDPEKWACPYFAFRLSKRELQIKRSEYARTELLHWLAWQSEETRNRFFQPEWFTYRMGRCPNLGCRRRDRIFYYRVYKRVKVQRFCSDHCKREFNRFVRKIQRNSERIRGCYQVNG